MDRGRERQRLYDIAIAPYVFWTDALSQNRAFPRIRSSTRTTRLSFLLELAAHTNHIGLPGNRGREVGATRLEPRRLRVSVTDWTNPRASPVEPPVFGPPIGVRLGPKRREDIPLIELAPTDNR